MLKYSLNKQIKYANISKFGKIKLIEFEIGSL